MHMVPGLIGWDALGVEAPSPTQSAESYCAAVLARIFDSVLRHYKPGRALLVNYRDLPEALWTEVLPHFGVPCGTAEDGLPASLQIAGRAGADALVLAAGALLSPL